MKLLFLGDVVGRSGREAVKRWLPELRARHAIDFAVVEAENAAAGFGCTAKIAQELLEAGADCLTLGDHAFDQKDLMPHLASESRILRPLNIAKSAPGAGLRIFDAPRGKRVAVAVALGRVFMKQPYDDPFSALDAALKAAPLGGGQGGGVDAVIVEAHAEATSEKQGLGWFLDGRASLVVGAHTHVPTADARILPKGTAFLTDAGMCGDYATVIGMDRAEPLRRFITGLPGARFTPGEGEGSVSGVVVETGADGRAISVQAVREGPGFALSPAPRPV